MQIVQYGDYKIEVDIEKTRKYYDKFTIPNTQANKNFAEYCKIMSVDERKFFEAFGINPLCCHIDHCGVTKNKEIPCGGQYYICGKYLECPPENLISVEELMANNFVDNRLDTRIHIGMFQFDFQCPEHEINDIPQNIPEGFICVDFWCEEMKWYLNEEPEIYAYEPPKFWEIHKIIKSKKEDRKQELEIICEQKTECEKLFESLGVSYTEMSKKELKLYKEKWVAEFALSNANIREIKKVCLDSRKYKTYLWNLFSFRFLEAKTEEEANELFNKEQPQSCVFINNWINIAYRLTNSKRLTAEILESLYDVTITAEDFVWTYSKTHEDMEGPYFYGK